MRSTAALARCCLLVTVAIGVGLALHRIEIAALAAPFVLGPAALYNRTSVVPRVRLQTLQSATTEGDAVDALVTVSSPVALDAVSIDLTVGEFSSGSGVTRWTVALDAGEEKQLVVPVTSDHWGRRSVGPVSAVGRGPGLFNETLTSQAEPARLDVVPAAEVFRAAPEVPHALVFAGEHRSPQDGAGTSFSHVRPFDPGDRLRRINWRATLKSRQLHVTSTHAERSTEVLVVLDAAHDAGPRGRSVLDVAVRAATAITEHYLSLGDIVGIVEYGDRHRQVRRAPGRRQQDRIRQWLLDVRAPQRGQVTTETPWLAELRIARSLVIVLTPLLDDHAATELVAIRQRGAAMVAVDTLSPEARPEVHDPIEALALRLWLLERSRVIRRLTDFGVPVVSWEGAGSLDAVLRDVARIAAAPRLVNR